MSTAGRYWGRLGSAFLIAGCISSSGLPKPPGMLGVARSNTFEVSGATVTVMRCESVDTVAKVGEFYQKELGTRPGWTTSYKKGVEIAYWTDGNMVCENLDTFKPKDAKKTGSYVLLTVGKDNGSYIQLATSEPKGK